MGLRTIGRAGEVISNATSATSSTLRTSDRYLTLQMIFFSGRGPSTLAATELSLAATSSASASTINDSLSMWRREMLELSRANGATDLTAAENSRMSRTARIVYSLGMAPT